MLRLFLFGIAILWTSPAAAQHEKQRQALNNIHQEVVACIAYYNIMKQCLSKNPTGKATAEQTEKVIANLLEFAAQIGTSINLTNDAMASRLKLHTEEQMTLINSDCVNASSLISRYANHCKTVTENPTACFPNT